MAVLGAGPAGLMAALGAAERGHDVAVFEAQDRVGGMAGSFEVSGQLVDYGSHRLHPAIDPQLMERLRGLLGNDLQRRERNGRLRLRDKWIGFPLRAFDMVRHMPFGFTAGLAGDLALKPFRTADPSTFAGEVESRLGPTVANEVFAPYAEKLYGQSPSRLDRELATRRVSAKSVSQIAKKVFRAGRGAGRTFYYPRSGYGQISDRLAQAAVDAGVVIHLGTRVDEVRAGTTCQVRTANSETEFDLALSTLPLPVLSAALRPRPPAAVSEAIASLRSRAMVLVYLVVPRPQYTPFDAHYLPGTDVRMSRLSEPKNYRNGDDPPDQTVLCAEIPCWDGDEIWEASPTSLAELVCDDLARVGLPPVDHVGVEVRHLNAVYPIYDVETTDARRAVEQWLRTPSSVISLGRQGLGVPDNLHHVLAMGEAASSALGGTGEFDTAAWSGSLDTFSNHVVED
ncbi:MAG: protoporphyrinogen/coproporphyrinogen oxidase [Acidimicrobiales bacterium]